MSLLDQDDINEIGRGILEAQWQLPKKPEERQALRTIVKTFATTHVPALLRCITTGNGIRVAERAAFQYLWTVIKSSLAGFPPHAKLITNAEEFLTEHLPNFQEGPEELKRSYVLAGSKTSRVFMETEGQLFKLARTAMNPTTTDFVQLWGKFVEFLGDKLDDMTFLCAQMPLEQLMPHSESDVINAFRDHCVTPILDYIVPALFSDQWAVDHKDVSYPMQELVFEHLAEAGIKFTQTVLPGAGPENPHVSVSRPPGSTEPDPKADPTDDAADSGEKKAYLRMDSVGVVRARGDREAAQAQQEALNGKFTRSRKAALEEAKSYGDFKHQYVGYKPEEDRFWTSTNIWTHYRGIFVLEYKGWGILSKANFMALAQVLKHGLGGTLPPGTEPGVRNLRTILYQALQYGLVVNLDMVLLTDYASTVLLWIQEVSKDDAKTYNIKWMHLESMVIPWPVTKPGAKNESKLTARWLLLFVIWMGHEKLKICMEQFAQNLPKKSKK